MLYFFTDPYEDELMFSALARYNRYSGNLSSRKTQEELLGRRTSNLFIGFPSHLNYFSKQFVDNSKYLPEYFIDNHTIFPIYKMFLPKSRIPQLLDDMKGDKSVAIHMRIGEAAGGICKDFGIRCCIRCMDEDIRAYGEVYIHRIHQVPGNQICNKHSEALRKVILPQYLGQWQLIDLNTYTIESKNQIVSDESFQHFKSLSQDISKVFEDTTKMMSLEDVIRKYKLMLMKKGLSSIGGITHWDRVEKELLDFYPSEFLNKLESNIVEEGNYKWTRQLLNEKKLVHPIRHLLFIRFLFGNINNFIVFNELEYRPFGLGPWPCLNPVASHYKKEVVTDLELSKRSSKVTKPLGIFKCNCGYIYTRLGPDKNNDDKYKKRTVKSYGHIWLNALKDNILKQIYNISELQTVMGCDSKTIGKYAKELGVFNLLNSKMKIEPGKQKNVTRYDESLEKIYKSDIILFIKNNPNSTRSDIEKNLRKQRAWLRRYRKDWLNFTLPDPLDKFVDRRNKKIYVDWNDRDDKSSIMVQKIINEIKSKEGNFKITLAFLRRKIKFLVDKNLDKLPKTKQILKINRVIK